MVTQRPLKGTNQYLYRDFSKDLADYMAHLSYIVYLGLFLIISGKK